MTEIGDELWDGSFESEKKDDAIAGIVQMSGLIAGAAPSVAEKL
ncbi:hypothetical protein [Paraburkholderia aromaticivorans]|nr:hypothetical protein [Paraburkholderia aromaticivorans]